MVLTRISTGTEASGAARDSVSRIAAGAPSSDEERRSRSPIDSDSSRRSGKFWRKWQHQMDDGASSADSDDVASKTPTPRGGGGIGCPATTGAYVGLAKAKAEYLTQCEKEMELKVKKEATEITHHIRERRLANYLSEYVITSEILTLDLYASGSSSAWRQSEKWQRFQRT